MNESIRFGSAGNPDAFYKAGLKSSWQMPAWLAAQGLSAYEYSAGRGVKIGKDSAQKIAEQAQEHNIALSIHAPYYINLATFDADKIANNERYLTESFQAAEYLGADRVVFHVGSPVKLERNLAFTQVQKNLYQFLEKLETTDEKVFFCPETMGKKNQIGTLEEIVTLCKLSPRLLPTIDFGHLHAAQNGGFDIIDDYLKTFEYLAQNLGEAILYKFHVHFSKIEFTKAGEKKHWTFADSYGPPFEPFMQALAKTGYKPRIICESNGTQAQDAKEMFEYYKKLNLKLNDNNLEKDVFE